MNNLVSPFQVFFVLGKHIQENVVVAQEIFHSIRKKNTRKQYMAMKVDLEKAYDKLSWSFIEETLNFARTPGDLIMLIMDFISLVSFQV